MRTGEILDAGLAVLPGRSSEGVPYQAVDARTEYPVDQSFQVTGRPFPVRADAGRAFGFDEPLTVGMRRTGALPHRQARLLGGDVRSGARPVFTVGNIACAHDLQSVDRRVTGPPGLGVYQHAVRVGELPERLIVVVEDAVADRPADVLQKTVRHLGAVDDTAGHHRQVGPEIVAPEFPELFGETVRPVDEPHFPAVGQQELNAVPLFPRSPDQRLQHMLAERIEGVGIQVVERQARPSVARSRGMGSGACPAVADHRPLPCRGVPFERLAVVKRRQVEYLLPGEGLGTGIVIKVGAQSFKRKHLLETQSAEKRLGRPVRDSLIAHRSALRSLFHGLHTDILIHIPCRRLRQFQFDPVSSGDVGFRPGQFFQGQFGRDIRPAGIPAAGHVDGEGDPQPVGLAHRMAVKRHPAGREEHVARPGLSGHLVESPGVDQRGRPVAFGLHLFEVAGDRRLGGDPVQPPPVTRHPGLAGRRSEFFGQFPGRNLRYGRQAEIGLRSGTLPGNQGEEKNNR